MNVIFLFFHKMPYEIVNIVCFNIKLKIDIIIFGIKSNKYNSYSNICNQDLIKTSLSYARVAAMTSMQTNNFETFSVKHSLNTGETLVKN